MQTRSIQIEATVNAEHTATVMVEALKNVDGRHAHVKCFEETKPAKVVLKVGWQGNPYQARLTLGMSNDAEELVGFETLLLKALRRAGYVCLDADRFPSKPVEETHAGTG